MNRANALVLIGCILVACMPTMSVADTLGSGANGGFTPLAPLATTPVTPFTTSTLSLTWGINEVAFTKITAVTYTTTNPKYAIFGATDANNNGYLGRLNMSNGESDIVGLTVAGDALTVKNLVTVGAIAGNVAPEQVLVWFNDNTVGLYDASAGLTMKWAKKIDEIATANSMAKVYYTTTKNTSVYVISSAAVVELNRDTGAIIKYLRLDTIDGRHTMVQSVVGINADELVVAAISSTQATTWENPLSILYYVNLGDNPSSRVYYYNLAVNTVLNMNVLLTYVSSSNAGEFKVYGTFVAIGAGADNADNNYFLSTDSITATDFFANTYNGNLKFYTSQSTMPKYAYGVVPSADTTVSMYGLTTQNTFFSWEDNTLRQYSLKTAGCTTFMADSVVSYGTGSVGTVLIAGLATSVTGGKYLMLMSWKVSNVAPAPGAIAYPFSAAVITAGNISTVSPLSVVGSTVLNWGPTAVANPGSSDATIDVVTKTLIIGNNDQALVQLSGLANFTDNQLTYQDSNFLPTNGEFVYGKTSDDLTFNADNNTFGIAANANAANNLVSGNINVTLKNTLNCIAPVIGLPSQPDAESFAIIANEKNPMGLTSLSTFGSFESPANTSTFWFLNAANEAEILVESTTISPAPIKKFRSSANLADLSYIIGIPEHFGDYIMVTSSKVFRVNQYSENIWSRNLSANTLVYIRIDPEDASLLDLLAAQGDSLIFSTLNLKTGATVGTPTVIELSSTFNVTSIQGSGANILVLYTVQQSQSSVIYNLMKLDLTANNNKIVFNRSINLEGAEVYNRVTAAITEDYYVIAGSFNSDFAFIGAFDMNDGELSTAQVAQIDGVNNTSLVVKEGNTVFLANSSNSGARIYEITIANGAAAGDPPVIQFPSVQNISSGDADAFTFSLVNLKKTTNGSLIGHGYLTSTMYYQPYPAQPRVARTYVFVKLTNTGVLTGTTDNSILRHNTVNDGIADNWTEIQGKMFPQESQEVPSNQASVFTTNPASGVTISAIQTPVIAPQVEKTYVSPNLAISPIPRQGDIDALVIVPGKPFNYEIDANFEAPANADQCQIVLSSPVGTATQVPETCGHNAVVWENINHLTVDGLTIKSANNDVIPCNITDFGIPFLGQCYGFFQHQYFVNANLKPVAANPGNGGNNGGEEDEENNEEHHQEEEENDEQDNHEENQNEEHTNEEEEKKEEEEHEEEEKGTAQGGGTHKTKHDGASGLFDASKLFGLLVFTIVSLWA